MKGIQKVGGVGALLLAVSFVLIFVSQVVRPSLGIAGPEDEANPAKILPVASTYGILLSVPLILFAVAVTLTTLGLNDRLQERSPTRMRIAAAAGLGGAVLFLGAGMFAFKGLPALAGVYSQDPAGVTAGDLAVAGGLADGLITAAIFATGWFVLLASWAALQGGLPKILSYLGLLWGAVSVLAFAVPPFQFLGVPLGLVWGIWLGLVLLREPAMMGMTGMPAR